MNIDVTVSSENGLLKIPTGNSGYFKEHDSMATISSAKYYNNTDSSPLYDIKISHAMAIACSALYCIKLIAVGFAFPLAYLIMFNTEEGFGAAIYRGYPIYLYIVGILFQLFYIVKRLWYRNNETENDDGLIVSKTSRILTAICGLISAVWFLLLFSWIIDVSKGKNECRERNMEAASLILAFVYTALNIGIGITSSKFMMSGTLFVTMFGVMHMIATNLSTWGWTCAHFIVLTVMSIKPNATEKLDCEMGSPLGSFVYESHSYFGIFVCIYFLVSSALLFSVFSKHYEKITLRETKVEETSLVIGGGTKKIAKKFVEPTNQNNSFIKAFSYGPGTIIGCLATAGAIIFAIYHYELILRWNMTETGVLSMSIVDTFLNSAACLICILSLWALNKNLHNRSDHNRPVLFESLILIGGLFMLYVGSISYAITNFRRDSYTNHWAAMRCILDILEASLQTTYLLTSAKYECKVLPDKFAYFSDRSCGAYMIAHNIIMATLAMIRQRDNAYGLIYISTYGIWFWSVYKFAVNAFIILFRLYSAVFYFTTCARSVKLE